MTIEEARAIWTEVCENAIDLVIEGYAKNINEAMEYSLMGVTISRFLKQIRRKKQKQ